MLFEKKRVSLNEMESNREQPPQLVESPVSTESELTTPNNGEPPSVSGPVGGAAQVEANRGTRLKSPWGAFFARMLAALIDYALVFVPVALFALGALAVWLSNTTFDLSEQVLPVLLVSLTVASCTAIPGLALLLAMIMIVVMIPPLLLLPFELFWLPIGLLLLAELAGWLYGAGCEASPMRATIGKKLLGFTVTNKEGGQVGFWRTTVRHFAKGLSALSLILPGLSLVANSGVTLHDRIAGCRVDGAPPLVPAKPQPPAGDVKFAPLWRRISAAAIDASIIVSMELFFGNLLSICIMNLFQVSDFDSALLLYICVLPFCVIPLVMPMLLMAVCEWSPLQATPGKLIFGLKVTSPEGLRLSFRSSCYKQFVQYALWLSIWPCYAIASLCLASGTLGQYAPFLIGFWSAVYCAMLCVTFRGTAKQSLADRMSNRFVICGNSESKQNLISEQPSLLKNRSFIGLACTVFLLATFAGGNALQLEPRRQAASAALKSVWEAGNPLSNHWRWKGGWVTAKGEFVSPPDSLEVLSFSQTCAPAYSATGARKWGFVDEHANWIIKPQFDGAKNFNEGLAPAAVRGKWGLIDQHGNWVIKPQFDDVGLVSQGFAVVRNRLQFGYVDRAGRFLVNEPLVKALPFSEGFAVARLEDGSWTYIHSSGAMSKPRRGEISSFSEGLAAAEQEGKWGYINFAGKWVLPPTYTSAEPFSNGHALVRKGSKSLLIDRQGHVLQSGLRLYAIQTPSPIALPAIVKEGDTTRVGFVDSTGTFVVRPELKGMQPYLNGESFAYTKDQTVDDRSHAMYQPQVKFETDQTDQTEQDSPSSKE